MAIHLSRILFLIGLTFAQVQATNHPLNVVFILADDLGWKDLGCTGSEHFKTPNIDALAKGGMRFTQGYAGSCVCSPTRASIVTGKYPARLDLTTWLGGGGGAPAVGSLPLEEFTIAEAFKAGGYATGMVGKWHLGPEKYWPKQQGFDVAIGPPHTGSPAGGYYLPNRIQLPGAKQGDYLTDRLGEEGAKFIRDHHDEPFFLYQAFHSVHTPIQGRPDLVASEEARRKSVDGAWNTKYSAMVKSLDAAVGRIVSELRKHQILDRTVIVFTSDNGGFSHSRGKRNGITDNSPLRRGKGWNYEGGNRVPWIICAPGTVPAGTTCDQPVISTDFYPTLLELADLPARPTQHVDGVSLAAQLRDPKTPLKRKTLYWHFPHHSPQGGPPSGAMREGNWKLIEFFRDGKNRVELYDLAADMSEKTNLSVTQPDRAAALHEKLRTWQKSVAAKLPPPGGNPPNRAGKPKSPSASRTIIPVGKVTNTKKFPGFASLENVQIKSLADGTFELTAKGTGTALRKIKPTGSLDHTIQITPRDGHPANGFLAFGPTKDDADLIKVGVFVSGKTLSIFEGAYPAKLKTQERLVVAPGEPVTIRIQYSVETGTVLASSGKIVARHKLINSISDISYLGYQVIRTHSTFSNQ